MADPSVESEGLENEELEEEPESGEGTGEPPEKKEPAKPAIPPEEDEEPPMRRSAKDFIIARKEQKIKKLEAKEDEIDEDEDLSPEGKGAIRKEVEAQTSPIIKGLRSQADEQELKDVFDKYPGAKEMEKQIRKYMDSETYKNASVEFIYLGLAARKMELDKKRAEADAEADEKGLGGTSRRPKSLGKIPDVSTMTDAQVDELAHKVKTGQA